jgi:acrylyl-CoA reductase (NADPH)
LRALVTRQNQAGTVGSGVEHVDESALPEGEVLVAVEWSSLNYKDALCLLGLADIVRRFPNVAGIDFAGRVLESRDRRYHPGQGVILNGWRVGEGHWGGYAQRARVKADWLVPLPTKLSTRSAMVLGTAGLTAMLAANRLRGEGVTPDKGRVLVLGAGGGVGSLAVMLLARLGYHVSAATGRPGLGEHLVWFGAQEVLSRNDVTANPDKALDRERWAATVDPVGGPMLGEVLKQLRYGGVVASIGGAGGVEWQASLLPFILRSVTLAGVDSVMAPFESRLAAWDRVVDLFSPAAYEPMVTEIKLEELPTWAEKILNGGVAGRVIVDPREAAA